MYRSLILLLLFTLPITAQTREEKVRNDRKKIEAAGYWIYNDLAQGIAEAKQSGKPLVVLLRCVPCEECVKLDEDLVDQDRRVRPLLEQFVRVRLITTNGLDLSTFQFDYDQSFAAFFLNADGTIYGRYGTRSHRTAWSDDVAIEGLAKALDGALALHREFPMNKADLASKKGPTPLAAAPELLPRLKGKYTNALDFAGKVVPSCIHCHQVGEAIRHELNLKAGKPTDEVLFPYPHPKSQGLILDPKERATVLRVEPRSSAERAGFRPGDLIRKLAGQLPLSIADVQWVLHRVPAGGTTLTAEIERAGQLRELKWELPAGWRRRDDIAWRASTWELRRIALGGLQLEASAQDEQGLKVLHVGQYSPHDIAKRAGFLAGDTIVSIAGRSDLRRETDAILYALTERKPGAAMQVAIMREGQPRTLTLKLTD